MIKLIKHFMGEEFYLFENFPKGAECVVIPTRRSYGRSSDTGNVKYGIIAGSWIGTERGYEEGRIKLDDVRIFPNVFRYPFEKRLRLPISYKELYKFLVGIRDPKYGGDMKKHLEGIGSYNTEAINQVVEERLPDVFRQVGKDSTYPPNIVDEDPLMTFLRELEDERFPRKPYVVQAGGKPAWSDFTACIYFKQ